MAKANRGGKRGTDFSELSSNREVAETTNLSIEGWQPKEVKSLEDTKNFVYKKLLEEDYEHVVLIDSDGYVRAVGKGGKHTVSLTKEMKAAGVNDLCAIHNHPSGGLFTPEDILVATSNNLAEMSAISRKYGKIYTFTKGKNAKPKKLHKQMSKDKDSIITAYKNVKQRANNSLISEFKGEKYYYNYINDVRENILETWMNKYATKCGYTYTVTTF